MRNAIVTYRVGGADKLTTPRSQIVWHMKLNYGTTQSNQNLLTITAGGDPGLVGTRATDVVRINNSTGLIQEINNSTKAELE